MRRAESRGWPALLALAFGVAAVAAADEPRSPGPYRFGLLYITPRLDLNAGLETNVYANRFYSLPAEQSGVRASWAP